MGWKYIAWCLHSVSARSKWDIPYSSSSHACAKYQSFFLRSYTAYIQMEEGNMKHKALIPAM